MSLRIVNWNVEWAPRHTDRGKELRQRIADEQPEVVCLTESDLDFMDGGHVITSAADYGYRNPPSRRKVLLWSRRPWTPDHGVTALRTPSGRYVRGTTETSLGPITFIGVCIPWKDAHVRTGRRDRKPWEDHEAYLERLGVILKRWAGKRTIVLGDFNQTIPRTRAPERLFDKLTKALSGFEVATTTNQLPGSKTPPIDHVVHSRGLHAVKVRALDNHDARGKQLSDHFGLSASFALSKT